MKVKKRQGILEISVWIVKVVLAFLLVFNAVILFYYGALNRVDQHNGEPFQFIESWTVVDSDGNTFTTGRSYLADNPGPKQYTLYTTLPETIEDNEFLFFDTRKDTAVYINGELRKDHIYKRDVKIPGGAVKRYYMMVPLQQTDCGAEIKIIMTSELNDEQVVPEFFISTRYGEFGYLMKRGGLLFFLASIVLIFSLVAFIVSVILRFWYKMKIDMMYGALGIFVIASWLVTDSDLFPYLFGVNYVNGILNYMLCTMIPFAPAIYLNSIQGGRYRRNMSLIMLVSSVNAIIWPTLHFTGIVPFYNMRTIGNLILAGMAVLAIFILTFDAVKGSIVEYKYTFTGFFGFLICCIVELTTILLVKTYDQSIIMVFGLGFLLTFVVIQQVDDLRKIRMEKQHAIDISEAKTRFLASMSHEIRTPINAILGMNEMILRENNDKVIEEYSRSIKTSGKMLLMLVNDVLDFSKIEAGKMEIIEKRFKMSDMLRDVLSLVKERADEKSLELKTEITDEIPDELISDEFRIRQILVNLINNAVKYTEKGIVTLKVGGSFTEKGYELSLVVKDTGKGIRKEEQAHLFEAFSRADLKSNSNIEGTGLGLAIVKSIVDSMKGSIGVESEYGIGSEFWVKLPVSYENREPLKSDFMESRSRIGQIDEAESFTAPEARVLAVDDNQSNLTIVRLFLKRTGIELDLCSTGQRAIELCRLKRYDLLLLDHMMPVPDGIETLHTIRADEESLNHDTRAVVLTANAVAGSRQMYMDEGFDDYLTKPLDSKVLEQTVKRMLPKEKVNEGLKTEGDVLEFRAQTEKSGSKDGGQGESMSPIKKRLTSIEGLAYDTALAYCGGDEEFLEEIVGDMASGCDERCERMKQSLAEKDIKAYEIDAHSIKSNMATVGMKAFSERAKKHELAAKDNDTEFILKDAEDFLEEYIRICKQLKG